MNDYKLDRTVFKMQTFEEADMQYEYWEKQSIEERFRAAFYLNSIAYSFDLNNPPRMDKTVFFMRKLAR